MELEGSSMTGVVIIYQIEHNLYSLTIKIHPY